MLPRAAGDEETRREGQEMGLDLLGLGLLLPPPTMADGGGGSSSSAQRWPTYEKTGFDEPLDDGVVPAPPPPASMPNLPAAWAPAAQAAASSSPNKLGSFRGLCSFQVPSSSITPSSASASDDQMAGAGGHASSPLMQQRAPCRAPPVAASGRLIFEGSTSAAAARGNHGDYSAAPMTIIYAGSVRAYDGVTLEQAEKILGMVAKEAHAAGMLAEPQLQLAVAAAPTGDPALMTMHWTLAHHVNDSLKRTASLARFLDKRKQRAESAAAETMLHHPRRDREEEWFPDDAQVMDAAGAPAATVSARTSASLGGVHRRPRASQDHPRRMDMMEASHHGEEAVSTELRI